MIELTKNEEILLLSVYQLKHEAYGFFIRRHIKKTTGRQWNYGSLYRMLGQLVTKGLLLRIEGEPMPERGGRRKNFYSLSKEGLVVLQKAHIQQKALWGQVEEISLENRGKK